MIRYCYRRILLAVPVMIGISLLAFVLGLLSPGDPAEFALHQDGLDAPTDAQIAMMREELGLNRPIYVQYSAGLCRCCMVISAAATLAARIFCMSFCCACR